MNHSETTLDYFFEEDYLPARPSLSNRTVTLYKYSIRKFSDYLGHQAKLEDFKNSVVGKYLRHLGKSQKPAGVDKERRQLLALWRFAHTLAMVSRGPTVQQIKVPIPIPRAMTIQEVRRLYDALPLLQGTTAGLPNEDFMRAILSIQFTLGCRIGEVLQLEWADITGNVITFRAETRKGGRKSIVRKVPDYVIENIKALRRGTRDRIFDVPKGCTKPQTLYFRLFERAGVERQPGKSSHAIRVTHATLLNNAGGNASISLGHSSPHTTFTHYIDPRSKLEENFKLLPNLSEPAGETLEPAPDEPAIEPPTQPPPLADVVDTDPGEPSAASVGPTLASESVTLIDFLRDHYLPNRRSVNINKIQGRHELAIQRLGLTIGVVPRLTDLTAKNLAWSLRKTAKDVTQSTAFRDAKRICALWKHAFTKGMIKNLPPTEPDWKARFAKEAEKAK